MQQYGNKYFAGSPASPPNLGVKRLKFNFLEHDHVSYQNKGNRKCSNIVAWQPPLPSKGQNSTFSEHGHVAHQRE